MSMKTLAGKVALITGCGRKKGIGFACAKRLSEEGAKVVVTDLKCPAECLTTEKNEKGEIAPEGPEAIATLLKEEGAQALALYADLCDPASVEELIKKIEAEFGRIDILVNNAGCSVDPAPLTQLTLEAWGKTLAVNLTGTFLCCRAVAPVMITGGGGKIINISSRAAHRGALWMHAYSASKAGVLGLTKSMALELAPFNICVNALCPGDIETDLKQWGLEMEARAKGTTTAALKEEIKRATPLGRLGTPDDVAGVVAFFASADSDYLTGEIINISGGHGLGNATTRPAF